MAFQQQNHRMNGVQGQSLLLRPPWIVGRGRRRQAPSSSLQPLPDVDGPGTDDDDAAAAAGAGQVDGRSSVCCLPSGCRRSKDLIAASDPGDAVRVVCSNDACSIGGWMHGDCFEDWEQRVLSCLLHSCGRAGGWSEKQSLQGVWTKKGYDLTFKPCECKCGKGHLNKNLDYVPSKKKPDEHHLKRQKKNRMVQSPGCKSSLRPQHHFLESFNRAPLRVRTHSLCSTSSSPSSSDGTPPMTPGSAPVRSSSGGRFDFFVDEEQAAVGNIFWRRMDLSAFALLPRQNRNPYQIKIEDEGPHGNDATRSFILTQLSAHKITFVDCSVCQIKLPVYDKYPLIDGSFFLSPFQYNKNNISVIHNHKAVFLNAVCMRCLGCGTKDDVVLRCLSCKAPWSGTTLVIGTMYAYDIFAAVPCCEARLACKTCCKTVLKAGSVFPFFSDYSRSVKCVSCGAEDYHFIKPLEMTFFQSCGSQLLGQLL